MDRRGNFDSFRGRRTRPDSRRVNRNFDSSNRNSNGDNNSHPVEDNSNGHNNGRSVEGIEGAMSSLSLSENRNDLNSGDALGAGGGNGSLSLYNGENLYVFDGVEDYYNYNTDVHVQDFIGVTNYFPVPSAIPDPSAVLDPSAINGNMFSSSNSNVLYNGPSLQGLGNSQYFDHNGPSLQGLGNSQYYGNSLQGLGNSQYFDHNGPTRQGLGNSQYFDHNGPSHQGLGNSQYGNRHQGLGNSQYYGTRHQGLGNSQYYGNSLQGLGISQYFNQGIGNSQYFNHNGTHERNFFAPSSGYSPRSSVEPFPSSNRNRHRRHTIDLPTGVNANMSPNGGVSARNRAIPLGFEGISLSDLRGKIVALATDQTGYRILLPLMDNIDEGGVAMILAEVIDRISELMVDEFGNYMVQKLLEICTDEQKNQILLAVTRINFQLVRISVDMHGSRVVQKLLKHLTSQQQISRVISALRPAVILLSKDNNGHHVIETCVKLFAPEDTEILLKEVVRNSYAIATDRNGCCVMQSILNSKGETRELIVADTIQNSRLLSMDGYGNYVVQHAIALRDPGITTRLFRELRGHFFTLSRNKYGSNVVEKFITETVHSTEVITELLRNPNPSILLTDPYGNFVIQRALSAAQAGGPIYKTIVNLIEMNASAMQSSLFGKKILIRWFRKRQPAH